MIHLTCAMKKIFIYCPILFFVLLQNGICNENALITFINSDKHLSELLENAEIYEVSRKRIELYNELNGFAYVIVAYKHFTYDGSLMLKFCRAALARHYCSKKTKHLDQLDAPQEVLKRLNANLSLTLVLRGVETIGKKSENGWHFQGCKVKLDNIVPKTSFQYTYSLAKVYYELAKEYLSKDDIKSLTYFKRTMISEDVYNNSIAYVIPLLKNYDSAASDKLINEVLVIKNISDPGALINLGNFLLEQKKFNLAIDTFEKCQSICGNKVCENGLIKAYQKMEAYERKNIYQLETFIP